MGGEQIRIGGAELRFVTTATETAGHADVFEMTLPPRGQVPAAHRHEEVDETVYGLEGVLTYTVDGTVREVRAGDSLVIPRGAVHHFANLHEGTARSLNVQTPGKFGPAYFRELAAVLNAGGPPDRAKLGEIMGRYGVEPVLLAR